MKDVNDLIEETNNRIQKRFRHLLKWANKNNIQYFRIFDRDIAAAPFIIDYLPQHWLVWVCDNNYEQINEQKLIHNISVKLNELNPANVILKFRKKDNVINQIYSKKDVALVVNEWGLKFHLNLTRYLDTGLFIDHRKTREYIAKQVKGKRVLNLFSYTGSFSCYCLKGRASFVTSVDVNPTYSQWHHQNCELNKFSKRNYSICTADVLQFLKSNKTKYDIIICDPPTFSQSKRKHVKRFHIQENASQLLELCQTSLKHNGALLFSTNYRKFKLDQSQAELGFHAKELTAQLCSKDFDGKWMSRSWLIQF